MVRLGAAAVCTVLVAAGCAAAAARASVAGDQAIKSWALMDKCTRDAQAAFPDYSAEAYARRNAQVKTCLESHNLPPRAPIEPAPQ